MAIEHDATNVDGTYRIKAHGASRTVVIADGIARTDRLEATLGGAVPVTGVELEVILDTAQWRHDIPTWRWSVVDGNGDGSHLAAADLDDGAWRMVPHLHPVLTARPGGISWFRTSISLPDELHGRPIEVVIGGLDDQDWDAYTVYLGGLAVASWTGTGRIRSPRRLTIAADSPAYPAKGTPAVLAVRCEGLSRSVPDGVEHELEHYLFQDWLFDQFVAIGPPTASVDDFHVTECHWDAAAGRLELVLASASRPALMAAIAYAGADGVVRKTIQLRNQGTLPLAVLDVIGDHWRGTFASTDGGRGQPVVVGDLFTGIEHPAGVNQTDVGEVRLVQMPGITIPAGGSWTAQPIVLGGRDDVSVDSAFRTYITDIRPRPDRRVSVYSALGWYDFTNPADPLPELSEDLIKENLVQITELGGGRSPFDIYMIDDWWDWQDLGRFRRATFPSGGADITARIAAAGMRTGLWWATTRALWTPLEAPGIEASTANAPDFGAPAALAGGEWRWLEEFTNLFIGERRWCLASEPYRSMFLEHLPRLVRELGLGLLKLDCVVLHCTSSSHDHRAGRHSMEPMVDALRTVLQRCQEAAPDLRAIWYWGFRSPWYLRFGDMVFDKGLLMEAATVASAPAPTTRQSLSLNVDQAIHHARFLPLRLQDSLGVWLGNVAWCNRLGTEEWREAYLVDAARGSDLLQLWGDLTLLDTDDRAFMAAVTPWIARQQDAAAGTAVIGGDPWVGEPYGYVRPGDGGLIATVVNPGWSHATLRLDASLPGWPAAPWQALELYPYPGLASGSMDAGILLDLAPFEVRVLSIVPASASPRNVVAAARPPARASVHLPLEGMGSLRRSEGAGPLHAGGRITLPRVEREDALYVHQRLIRDGQWAYDAEPQALVAFDAKLEGLAASWETLPRFRDRNGPGSPWISRRIAIGPSWSDRAVDVTVSSSAPPDIEVQTQAILVNQWWRRRRRTFQDLMAADAS